MSFNYRIACSSSVSQVCEANRSNFFFDGKSMKKDNRGTSAPLAGAANSDAEQCVGIFDGIGSSEAAHVAINCLRYFLKQKNVDDTDYIKQLQDYFTASDRVITGLDGDGDKRVACTVGFIRYNGFYFATAGDCLVYLYRNSELNLLNPPENETRALGDNGEFAPEAIYGEIFTGDRIIICTTSLKKSISNDRFRLLIANNESAEGCVGALCDEAMTRGITDCVSACVIDVCEKTSEGYWILPGLIYTPETEKTPVYFEGDTQTIEISSGTAFANDSESEENIEETPLSEENITLPPPIKLPEPEPEISAVESPVVDESPKKPTASELKRAADEKKKRIIIISCVIAGVLLLGLIFTFVIKGIAANPVADDDTDSIVNDELDDEKENEDDDPVVTKSEDTEEENTDGEDSTDDTTEDTSSDTTEDTTTEESTSEEEPDEPDDATSNGYTIANKDGAYYVTVGRTEILVVNKTYELSKNYNPGGLTSETRSAFNNLVEAAAEDGLSITNQSGFRSYATQQNVYNGWVSTYGQTQADRISARPGHSEHQTGMAIDVNSLDESFGETPEGKWLAKNAYKFGFIIRYPEGKENVTGYAYEPWHIRYVGEIAEDIYNSGLTLEEYLGISSQY